MSFYMIFGTNLLTYTPEPVSVFSLFLSFTEKEYQNGVQLMCQFLMTFSGPKEAPGVKELGQDSPGLPTRVGARPPPWAWAPASWTTRRPP